MKIRCICAVALGLTFASTSLLAQGDGARQSGKGKSETIPSVGANAANSSSTDKSGGNKSGDNKPGDGKTGDNKLGDGKFSNPDWSDRRHHEPLPDNIKKLLDDFKAARAKFLQEQRDLERKLRNKDATEAQRDEIRSDMRDKRDQFLEQQRDLREEILKRVNELKDQLKDHQDLIDSAKENGKGRPRKGGDH